ncbi:hybrid sensor histidine kinase/response regulator [Pseudozobellia thermophila]|uniref:histidine kinase n=1 Tax=Pseudozobellia thermophila TaxID=192903 RepID=A0A1M6AL46_9FLAO|nr:ATP-binding protein [Pseudozobellia thermophila]SHI36933.1 Signal transduction histidine kinase [Pseudozobellia thermophila]
MGSESGRSKNKFTLKIIASYLVLALLTAGVGYFIYTEIKTYVSTETNDSNDEKLLKTSSLVTNLYEAESLSKLALQDGGQVKFDAYSKKIDSIQVEIDSLKQLMLGDEQKGLLDSLQVLLRQKVANNNELRKLKSKSAANNSLDKALKEFEKIEESFGKFSAENLFSDFDKLSPKVQQSLREYAALINSNAPKTGDPAENAEYVDSILNVSKEMLRKAKLEDSRSQRFLAQKEVEMIRNDLELSRQLQNIITAFEQEIMASSYNNSLKKRETLRRTTRIAGLAALLGFVIVAIFSFLITRDYWKVQTYRARLEKEKKFSESLLKSREQLISTVSHDLRTPLNTIGGYSELLESTDLSQKQLGYIKHVKSATEYVGNLVNDLLDFSKLEAGKLNIEDVPFIPAHLIQETAENLQALHKNKGLRLILNIAPELEQTVLGDPFRIRQVLTNLMGNAFKFTEEGHVKVDAFVERETGKSIWAKIAVSDTGIGIAKDKQHLIFKEFAQAEKNTEKKFGGYGLGLTISKKLAELLRGSLTLESQLGQGSTFCLQLPLEITEAVDPKDGELPYMAPKLRMLIIDDDTALLHMLRELAESMGITAHTYSNFLSIEQDSHLAYDIVLTDIQMPQVTGFEVLKKLRSGNYTHYKNQPIIAMTGRRDLGPEAYIGVGFTQVLQKPFSKGELVATLKLIGIEAGQPPVSEPSKADEKNRAPQLYNLDIIHSFLGKNEDALFDVLQTFLRDTRSNMALLEKTVKHKDYRQVNQVAHRMLPMFRQLKVRKSVSALEQMELATPEKIDGQTLDDLFYGLREEVDLLTKTLKERLATSPNCSG